MSDVQNRISSLRQLLEKENLFAWVSITSDPHASEYLPPHWADREWLSGFTGSAGTLIVTQHDALLWTDSRYWTQASGQLEGSGITLMKDGAPGVEGWDQWLSRHAPDGSSVGINGRSLSVRTADRLTGLLTPKGISLREDLDLSSRHALLDGFRAYARARIPSEQTLPPGGAACFAWCRLLHDLGAR